MNSLPVEVVEQIISEVPNAALLPLGLCCRGLNALVPTLSERTAFLVTLNGRYTRVGVDLLSLRWRALSTKASRIYDVADFIHTLKHSQAKRKQIRALHLEWSGMHERNDEELDRLLSTLAALKYLYLSIGPSYIYRTYPGVSGQHFPDLRFQEVRIF